MSATPSPRAAPPARRLPGGCLLPAALGLAGPCHAGEAAAAGGTLTEGLIVGDNLPYSGRDLNYTMNRHAEAEGRAYLGVELRQDLTQTPDDHGRWAALLAKIAQRVASGLR